MRRFYDINRRDFLALGGAASAFALMPANALAALEKETPLYGISAFGDLKYGPDFTHFDYANPDAPKGGTFNFSPPNWGFNQSVLTFNTLNSFVAGGDAPPRMELCFDSLFTGSLDEPDAMYGLVAESVSISEDNNSFTFKLRPQARFNDGTPLVAQDVAFTFNLLQERSHPSLQLPLAEMVEAVADDDHTFRITFSGEQSSRILFLVAGAPILSEEFYTENPFNASQLNPPLGSGPYEVGRFNAGQFIEYNRVEDYWARDLPVMRGLFHFDRIRIEFYRDRNAAFEAFKSGNINYRQEFTARNWATGYDFPAQNDGRVVMREFPGELVPSMQAWAVNTRRARFQDVRVRRAIGMCFDFEWTNRNLFYDAYTRSNSLFERSEFKTEGSPSEEELALMEQFRDDLPEEVFGDVYVQPQSDGSGRDRQLLRGARELLMEAGWEPSGGNMLQNENGDRLRLEFLIQDDSFERVVGPHVNNLRAIGVDATTRLVDSTQYQARQRDFDFDLVMTAASHGATPSRDALTNLFHSRAASVPGARNLPGTEDPVIDRLINIIGAADDREELIVAMKVLDRVLRARMDWIPNWHSENHRAAYWDMFEFDEPKPDYGFPVEALWWYDEDKARAIGRA